MSHIVCSILSSAALWIILTTWEVVKLFLIVFARYHVFLPCHSSCRPHHQRWFKAVLYAIIVFQCYVSSFVWMSLLFLYFHNLNCGNVLALVIIFVSSLVNAIFCFTAVYFNIKNRPHHIISKDEAKEMFKKLEVAVPEVRFQFYSFQPVAQYEEQFLPESWMDQTQESLNYIQMEQLLDVNSEFVALLKLEVRPFDKKTAEEYRMLLYRFAEKRSFNMNDIQILSIVEQAVPTMSIALTSHHCTRLLIVKDATQKQNNLFWFLTNIVCPYFGTYRNFLLKDQCIRLSVVKTFK